MVYASLALTAIVVAMLFIMLRKIGRLESLVTQITVNNTTAPAEKSVKETNQPREQRDPREHRENRGDHRDFRRERRYPDDERAKSQTPISAVDKSLRDINLKLKNAERDQEQARRRMTEGNEQRSNDRFQNRDRDRDRNRRPPFRKNREYNRDRGPQNHSSEPSQDNQNRNQRGEQNVAPPVIEPPVVNNSEEMIMEVAADNNVKNSSQPEVIGTVAEETYGRGSKITVKRRVLGKEEQEGSSEISQDAASSTDQSSLPENNKKELLNAENRKSESEAQDVAEETNISFGRR